MTTKTDHHNILEI